MSHITTVKTELRDGEVLRKALVKMGYQIREGKTSFARPAPLPANGIEFMAFKDGKELGFTRPGSGGESYDISADWGLIREKRRNIVDGIAQVYAREKIIKMARCRGYSIITQRINQKGQIEMVLRKVA